MGLSLVDDEGGPEVISPTILPTPPAQFGHRLTDIPTPDGLGTWAELMDELLAMVAVLQGKADAPIEAPYLSLHEVAAVYLSRAYALEMLILDAEHHGLVERGDDLQKFRSGPLQSFISMCRKMCDLGSRRLSQEQLLTDQRRGLGERF